jgi:penicillin-binding protein 1A
MRRQRIVLGKMLELKRIPQAQYDEALNPELRIIQESEDTSATKITSYFTDYVIKTVIGDLATKRGWSLSLAESVLYNGGLSVMTTMDPSVQQAIDTTFNTEPLFVRSKEAVADYPEHAQAVMAVNDQHTDRSGFVRRYGEKQ